MKNEKYFKKIAKTVNCMINAPFHISTNFNSVALYDLVQLMELHEFKQLLPDMPDEEILKAIESRRQIEFLYKNGITGWMDEVYHEKIVGRVGKDYIIEDDHHHNSFIHDLDYEKLVDRALEISKEFLKDDLKQAKRKKDGKKEN